MALLITEGSNLEGVCPFGGLGMYINKWSPQWNTHSFTPSFVSLFYYNLYETT
jgi:hypothetical protein